MSNVIDFNKKKAEILSKKTKKTQSSYENIDKDKAIKLLDNLTEKRQEKEEEEKRQQTINAFVDILNTPTIFD